MNNSRSVSFSIMQGTRAVIIYQGNGTFNFTQNFYLFCWIVIFMSTFRIVLRRLLCSFTKVEENAIISILGKDVCA